MARWPKLPLRLSVLFSISAMAGLMVGVMVALVLSVGLGLAPVEASTMAASPADEQAYVARINQLRASRGARALTVDANLTNLARQHTQEMANAGRLYHAGDLAAGVSLPWQRLGENVGTGSNLDLVWNAFVNSAGHFENIVNPSYTHIGVGVVYQNGQQWTTQRYLQLSGAPSPAPAPAPPAPPPTPAPAPRTPTPAPPGPRPAPTPTAPPTTLPPAPVIEPLAADPVCIAAVLDALHAGA